MFIPSYAALIGATLGTIADRPEDLKKLKYPDIKLCHHFIPIATETSGVLGANTRWFMLTGEAHQGDGRERGMHSFIAFRGYL